MVWLFLFIVLGLSCLYVIGGRHDTKEIDLLKSDSFIVTAILSTPAAHGILSLVEEDELQNSTLQDLQETLISNGFVDKSEWDQMLVDHLNQASFSADSKDLDIG
ncbi:hypothetical protein F0342_07695 [Bacillus sp. CH30_1T]|uniref:hypothetical protein n=1 Tax=Bacillus sp. CH30_1T TaxID=2604836 RepID=UPI0011EF76C6|nr:hypothetical protein [Bacillus sp. CH30_1T]KAA0564063.1 hypothetical protein F0342_07695 [Bacillus sp. CH30_1T]